MAIAPPRRRSLLSVVALLCVCGLARADDPLAALRAMYPEVRTLSAERQLYIHGTPMTPGQTAAEAAAGFLIQHGEVFGAGEPELRELWSTPTRDERFVVFAYHQEIRGKPVDGSMMRVKVQMGPLPRVDYAVARLAREPVLGSEAPVVTAEMAALLLMAHPGYGDRVVVGEPELVVLLGEGPRADAWAWRIRAMEPSVLSSARTYFVNTGTGEVVYVRDESSNADMTTGVVQGFGTPLADPACKWCAYRPTANLVELPIPRVRVEGAVSPPGPGQPSTFADGAGEFALELGTTGSLIVIDTGFHWSGAWYTVLDEYHEYLTASAAGQVGDHIMLGLANANMDLEHRVAQVDVVVTVNRAKDFYKQYVAATLPSEAEDLLLHTNAQSECHAVVGPPWMCQLGGYSGHTGYCMAFGTSGELPGDPRLGCWTYGNHGVAAHEWGHIALWVASPQIPTGGFHEGYADSFADMLNDDEVQGRKLYWDDSNTRDDPRSGHINCQYPMGSNNSDECKCSPSHNAGQMLSGVWVRIKEGYKAEFGDEVGLEEARKLFGAWTLVTAGHESGTCNTAWEGTALELRSILGIGFEYDEIICPAFGAHNIWCPE